MDLCKIFSGARSLGQDAGSGVVDRFIHNLMKYCKVTLRKVYVILFLSKTWCSIECPDSIHLWDGSSDLFPPGIVLFCMLGS